MVKSKILLVEDDVNALKGLIRILRADYSVSPFEYHTEALNSLKCGANYDIAVVDLSPRGADPQVDDPRYINGGEAIIRFIRDSRNQMPIIAMSGSSELGRIRGCGEDAYLQKPISPARLMEQIEELLMSPTYKH